MKFRRKLLATFVLTVLLSIGCVTWLTSQLTRESFERADQEHTRALVGQFRREFEQRGQEVVHRIESVARSKEAAQMAFALNHDSFDYGSYWNRAGIVAETRQLDFLEFLDSRGRILSSSQWPAKFGYNDDSWSPDSPTAAAFLKPEQLSDGTALGLVAEREVSAGANPLYVVGGVRLDSAFLAGLELPEGTRAMLYANLGEGFSPHALLTGSGRLGDGAPLMGLVRSLQRQPLETRALIHWSSDARGDETVYAIPLFAPDRRLLAIFLVGNSRRNYVELARGIRRAALLAALAGVLLATLLSGWAAARVTRPVEQLARAAREVTEGDWSAQVPVPSSCELKELATSFNRMTRELDEQKDRLVQAERVAAWRELARRLAHELKNPLFPLQLTVENLLRSRQQSATMFEETFAESSSTLLAEIANLNAIVSRFSDFSKMPQPQWQLVDLNEVVQGVARLHQARLAVASPAGVTSEVDLAQDMEPVVADPDLLHQALSNLVLNAFDAMPEGGRLTLRTRQRGEWSCLEVSDTGTGIPAEERARLFTPYYTTKAHGTGLGLAIVQSVASDHGARVTARSEAGRGTTFLIELPRNRERLGRRVLQASANRSKT